MFFYININALSGQSWVCLVILWFRIQGTEDRIQKTDDRKFEYRNPKFETISNTRN